MRTPALVLFALGLGVAWSIAAVVSGLPGIILGGAAGGTLAGLGGYISLLTSRDRALKGPSLPSIVSMWVLATIVGQALLRGIAVPLGRGMFGEFLWVSGSAICSGIAGAIGGSRTSISVDMRPKPDLAVVLRWSFGMILGGFFGGIVAWFHQPILGGMFGYSSGFMIRVAIGFFAAGAITGIVAGLIALPRTSSPS